MVSYRKVHEQATIVGGCSVFLASLFSIILIFQHLRSYTSPAEQKWIVGVLLMVPIYAIESIISLTNPKTSLACDILRNCYEAYALYAFGSYLFACLGGEERVVEILEDNSRSGPEEPLLETPEGKPQLHTKPFRNFFLRPCTLGKDLFSIIKFGLVQYMILKTVCAFLAFFLEMFGVYGDGEFKWYYGYPYITIILNFSQIWALYCLVQFYHVTYEKLKPIKPLAKFISFKAIVFATWWQGVGIALLCYLGVLPKDEKFKTGLQDFLICIEMAFASVAHVFVFSTQPYRFLPVSEYGRISSHIEKISVNVETGNDKAPTVTSKTETTKVKAPGTSITESVQDIVLEGGQQVVEDVKLTIQQAIEPVEKGVTKMQESLQHVTADSEGKQDLDVENTEHIKEESATIEDNIHQITENADGKMELDMKIEDHVQISY